MVREQRRDRENRKQFASIFHGNYEQQHSLFSDSKSTECFVCVRAKERERDRGERRIKEKICITQLRF